MDKINFALEILDLMSIEDKAYIVNVLLEEINDDSPNVFNNEQLLEKVTQLSVDAPCTSLNRKV